VTERVRVAVAVTATLVVVLAVLGWTTRASSSVATERDRWALPPDFSLGVDSTGYVLPTGIAMVAAPGSRPTDPRYFVTELGGTIKVVSRDGRVRVFARIPLRTPEHPYPDFEGESGLGAICLDDERGYVFVTYANTDEHGVVRNHARRFETRPRTFAVKPSASKAIAPVLASVPSGPSHQIGGCAVAGNTLFIGVGDGHDIARSSRKEDPVGKILRLTVDGRAAPDNPFVADRGAAALIYASGFRNPFGIAHVGDSLYAVQNGGALDAFLRVDRGTDYGWDGTDASIATNSLAVLSPSVGPAQLSHLPPGPGVFAARYGGTFFFATSTFRADRGGGVMAVRVDEASGRATTPESFVRYRGQTSGPLAAVAAVAVARDGLYFAPLSPSAGAATSAVLRVAYDGDADYPHVIGRETSGAALMQSYGCQSCHLVGGTGGRIAPSLDTDSLVDRLFFRLNSDRYRRRSEALDRLSEEPFRSFRDARREVRDADPSAKPEVWVTYKLLEPRFDDAKARMPKLGLTKPQAESIREVLLALEAPPQDSGQTFFARAQDVLSSKKFAAGVLGGVVLAMSAVLAVALVRRVQSGS
jgi:glucose/arabinose dehydrogenase